MTNIGGIENEDDIVNIISPSEFNESIEYIVHNTNIKYIDAIVNYCEENNIEIETVKILVSTSIKAKLEYEYGQLNYLPKEASIF